MAMRKDIIRTAEKLSAVSGVEVPHLCCWLLEVCKARGKNPGLIDFCARPGRVWVDGCFDSDYVADIRRPPRPVSDPRADFWENAILARQEKLCWDGE